MKAWIAAPAAVAVIALGAGVWGWSQLNDQYRGFSQPVMLEFRRGASSREMATELARAGVVPKLVALSGRPGIASRRTPAGG